MHRLFRLPLAVALGAAAIPAMAEDTSFEIVSSQHTFMVETVAEGLENPWGLDFLPDGRMIVTERPGRIRLVDADGTLSDPLANVPEIVSEFRDGLLDIAVSPSFSEDSTVFFAYSLKEGDMRWLQVASAQLDGTALTDLTVIHEAEVKSTHDQGFGSRIRFDDAGNMLISVGDHNEPPTSQDPSNTLGSIIRIATDGTPAADNPGGDLNPAILAYGFKNPQGLAIHPETGDVWATDHGGVGGGEINAVAAGENYGWPERTYGSGDAPRAATIGDFVEPVFTWGAAPTVALSGLEIYTGADFPLWQGDLFTGSLTQAALIRVMLDFDNRVVGTEYVIDGDLGRIREVRQGPDGMLYILNDEVEGGIYRLAPKTD
ncbi:MAG: PQQ-dependent sugar dehydrogenase [Pseudomonadota bacterium]